MVPWGGGAKLAGALPKPCIFCPKTAFFGPKGPWNPFKTAKRREVFRTFHMPLDLPVTKSPLLPSNSAKVSEKWLKMAKTSSDCAQFVSICPKTNSGPYLGVHGSNLQSEGT